MLQLVFFKLYLVLSEIFLEDFVIGRFQTIYLVMTIASNLLSKSELTKSLICYSGHSDSSILIILGLWMLETFWGGKGVEKRDREREVTQVSL